MSKRSQIKLIVYRNLPGFVKERIRAYAENKKMAYWAECFKTKVSKEQVDALFGKLALEHDVMIHSSLPEIGNIKLRHVTDNLWEYVINRGKTILCPAIPVKGSTLDYLMSIKEFDVKTAPNAMGTISCFYGRQEEARRSMSPTHSVIAFGKGSKEYTKEHHLSETPFTEKSPYFKLILNHGKILMFGASLRHLTFNHVLEDMIGEEVFPVKVYDSRRFKVSVVDEVGNRSECFFRGHSHQSGRLRDSEELMNMVRLLPSTSIFQIGCGEVILLDARDVIICLLNGLKSGITTMGRRKVSDACRRKADEWISFIQQL